jgi:hypothetical protein
MKDVSNKSVVICLISLLFHPSILPLYHIYYTTKFNVLLRKYIILETACRSVESASSTDAVPPQLPLPLNTIILLCVCAMD